MKTILIRVALFFALLFPAAPILADQSTTCLPVTGVVSGLSIVTGINAAHKAILTSSSGATPPANDCTGATVKGQPWLDTGSSPNLVKIFDGSVQQTLGALDTASGVWTPPIGGGATSVASAATTDLWSVAPGYVVITGTTTITKLAGSGAVVGTLKTVSFAGALTLTHDATQLILPGGRSIQTTVGDKAIVVALGGGNVAVVDYTPASGLAVNAAPTGHIDQFLLASCPATFVGADGSTIGDAASGATRANDDTQALFTAYWNLSNAASPILTSSGSASTRGASAAADFAAHKRLTSPDMRAQFIRGLDNGRGVDSGRALGTSQAFATSASGLSASSSASSSFVGDPLPPHAHTFPVFNDDGGSTGAADGRNGVSNNPGTSAVSAGTPTGSVFTSVSTSLSGAAETRPANVAALTCVKL